MTQVDGDPTFDSDIPPDQTSRRHPAATSTVLVISSHVMTGAVGNRAAAFALERLGHPVWEVPTVILPWHPGHGPSTRQTIDAGLFAKSLQDLANHPGFANLGAILTGYIGSVEQVHAVAKLVDQLKAVNSDALYLCDPVMGEESGLYIATEIAEAIRDELVPRADIITPNRFEFNWLTTSMEDRNEGLVKQSKVLNRQITMITSAFPMMRNSIANLLIRAATDGNNEQALLCEHRSVPNPPSGTGDMIAALFLARKLAGQSDEQALTLASSATLDVVSNSASQGYRDLEVARFADCFLQPMAMVNTRIITATPIVKKLKKYKPNSQ